MTEHIQDVAAVSTEPAREVNKRELARILDTTQPTLADLIDRYPDFPVIQEGTNGQPWKFDADAVIAFLTAKREETRAAEAARAAELDGLKLPFSLNGRDAGGGLTPGQELAAVKAASARLELDRKRGFLIDVSEMRETIAPMMETLGNFFEALPDSLGREFNLPSAVVIAIREKLEDERRSLHRRLVDSLDPQDPTDTDDLLSASG